MKPGLNTIPLTDCDETIIMCKKPGTPLFLDENNKLTTKPIGDEVARIVELVPNGYSRAFSHVMIYVECDKADK